MTFLRLNMTSVKNYGDSPLEDVAVNFEEYVSHMMDQSYSRNQIASSGET